MNDIDRMKQLIVRLNEAAKAYYAEDREIMSNRNTTGSMTSLLLWKKKQVLSWRRARPSLSDMKP